MELFKTLAAWDLSSERQQNSRWAVQVKLFESSKIFEPHPPQSEPTHSPNHRLWCIVPAATMCFVLQCIVNYSVHHQPNALIFSCPLLVQYYWYSTIKVLVKPKNYYTKPPPCRAPNAMCSSFYAGFDKMLYSPKPQDELLALPFCASVFFVPCELGSCDYQCTLQNHKMSWW